jgi:hypothetical protein
MGVPHLWLELHITPKLVYTYANSTLNAHYQLTAEYCPCCMSAYAALARFCLRSQNSSADNVADPAEVLTTVSPIQHTGAPHMVSNPWFSSADLQVV